MALVAKPRIYQVRHRTHDEFTTIVLIAHDA